MFEPFPKIPRLARDMMITEKIDGTNAQVVIMDHSLVEDRELCDSLTDTACILWSDNEMSVAAGSRKRYITPADDNFGFARWVQQHGEALTGLGSGRHFGEWWGCGIQRGYAMSEKRFSLFNASRWADERPACCDVGPMLYEGPFCVHKARQVMMELKSTGSHAAAAIGPIRYDNPEGIIVWHAHARQLFKMTYEDTHKGTQEG